MSSTLIPPRSLVSFGEVRRNHCPDLPAMQLTQILNIPMKHNIRDGFMVILAIMITGGMVHAMAPPATHTEAVKKPVTTQHVDNKPEVKPETVVKPVEVPEEVETPAPAPEAVSEAPTPVVSSEIDCDNQNTAKAFIYCHESGNDPSRYNTIGCRGIGQACPGTKLPCSDNDYGCQDEWFTNYMVNRYGSWESAKSFWQSNCGSAAGCWW